MAPVLSPRRAPPVAFWGLAAAWSALSLVDLPYVSVARVQAPAAAWVLMAAGMGVEGIAALRRRLPTLAGLTLLATVGLALAGSMVVTIPALWARTNAADEDDLLAEALAATAPGSRPNVSSAGVWLFLLVLAWGLGLLESPSNRITSA